MNSSSYVAFLLFHNKRFIVQFTILHRIDDYKNKILRIDDGLFFLKGWFILFKLAIVNVTNKITETIILGEIVHNL